ncbi:class I SAM-dependent methyltransferase [Acetobacterium sp.]|uniref:class I SAM-dependent methyltransferase n=1 Tax=Acetobacterium sp. TaxID=1872094 RepID=UPI002F4293AB
MNKTLSYYNNSARSFIEGTIDADLSDLRQRFLNYLPDSAHILDLGCGSGRDSKSFLEQGYTVTAMDGSIECCKLASDYIGQEVLCKTFEELDFDQAFEGVWACASLLHVAYEKLTGIFEKIAQALKPGGVLYASFKYGDFEGERNGRYFTDLTEKRLKVLLDPVEGFEIIETFVTEDMREDRDGEKWLDVILEKSCNRYVEKTRRDINY